jgi:hypothetical protein
MIFFDENGEYINPNKPFRLFRTFHRDRGKDYSYPDHIAMTTDELIELALALVDDPTTGPIFKQAGIHGDIGAEKESRISDLVEAYVAEKEWEKPDPCNLVAATVLARQLAGGGIAPEDKAAQRAFVDDKRCDGLGMWDRKRPLKVSEVIPILQWLEQRDELKAPFTKLRNTKEPRRPGQNYFESEEEGRRYTTLIEMMPTQMAYSKYGFANRNLSSVGNLIGSLTSYYTECLYGSYDIKIDRFDEDAAIAVMTNSYHQKDFINDLPEKEGI